MPKGQMISQEKIAEIKALRAQGLNVVEIASRTGVSTKSVTKFTYQNPAGLTLANDARESARSRILRAVAENSPVENVSELGQHVPDVDHHNLIHLLFSLNRQGLITYRLNKSGNQQRPERIAASRAGFAAAGLTRHENVLPSHTVGGPITVTHVAPVKHTTINPITPEEAKLCFVGGCRLEMAHEGSHDWATGPVENAIRYAAGDDGVRDDTHAVEPKTLPSTLSDPEVWSKTEVWSKDYPLTRNWINRDAKITAAAKMLEEAGLDDLALEVLAEIDTVSGIAREAIALYRIVFPEPSE